MARTEVEELMCRYALAGVEDFNEWQKSGGNTARSTIEKSLRARIAASKDDAMRAVCQQKGTNTHLVPARRLTTSDIEWAFFKPRQEGGRTEWMFDVVFWLPSCKHICFRLEPSDQGDDARHGYSHVQLSWRFNGKQSVPQRPLKWLPDSYPAFPIPGKCSLDRFLMLVTALQGFPACTKTVLIEIWRDRPRKGQDYVERVHSQNATVSGAT